MKHLTTILFVVAAQFGFGQDSTMYCQENASMFSNCYVFYSDGTFKHYLVTDDFYGHYGKGKYEDKGQRRFLYYGKLDSSYDNYDDKLYTKEVNSLQVLKKKNKKYVSKNYYEFLTNDRKVSFNKEETDSK